MLSGRTVAVVIPAHNEAGFIASTVASVPAWVDLVCVVDDGSTDETAQRARSVGRVVRVVSHARPRGVGAAIVRGYREALAQGVDVAIVMAGDGQMCPDDLPALLAPILRGDADYTKGNRFDHPDIGITMPRERYLAGRVLSALTRAATGQPAIGDSQCGYTAITRHALLALDLDALWPGYGYPNDLLGALALAGLRVQDVVVRPVYRGERSGLRAKHVLVILGLIARAGARRALASS